MTAATVLLAAVAADVTSKGYVQPPEEGLFDHLQRAETVAFLLQHTFGDDGSFADPCEAPGLKGMCAFVSAELQAAEKLSRELGLQRDSIDHASAIAQHMASLSMEEHPAGTIGFRLGDPTVSMAYWTIETLAKATFEELSA